MKPLEAIREALGSLRANKLRSFLTMLGVIIGVGAMLLMVAIVEGFQINIRKQFEGLGSRLVFVFYNPDENARRQARRTFEGLDLLDARALRARSAGLRHRRRDGAERVRPGRPAGARLAGERGAPDGGRSSGEEGARHRWQLR